MRQHPPEVWRLADSYPEVRNAYGAPAGVPLDQHVKTLTPRERRKAAQRLLSNPPGGTREKHR